ncbi:MAG: peptidoglycan-associated lipoprotein Pal [Candidatus Hydrogenedentes bacterium]|nr:peptidoglycan-associated lipoprotein Pal [Candidatus Hydrogenedentota bacterium]
MKRHARWTLVLATLCVAVLLVATPGCKRGKDATIDPSMAGPGGGDAGGGSGAGSGVEATTGTGLPGVDVEKLGKIERLKTAGTIYFDFDSSALRPDARETLKQNAEIMKQLPDVIIQVEGHCDERGTQEYNLALGERRALAARDFLVKLGVSGDRIITISYGEEFPADPGHDEAAWGKNRRAVFNKAEK